MRPLQAQPSRPDLASALSIDSEVSEGPNETREPCESNSEGKGLLDSLCATAAPHLSGAARRVMDAPLRECLRRKSLTS